MIHASHIDVKGNTVDDQTRCIHYHSAVDIIAIKFKCCGDYYPCFSCHEEAVQHEVIRWKQDEFDAKAILCGACKSELSIREYLNSNNKCPFCAAAFNPGCRNHYHLYFER